MTTITGQDVVEFRKRRNLSRKQLAQGTGLTEGKIWRIENKGNISPDEERALTLYGVNAVTIPEQVPRTVEVAAAPVRLDSPEVNFGDLVQYAKPKYERYVSNSELQTFKRCRRKWWLAWHRGFKLRVESPTGVRQIGDRLHRALKAHYVPGGPPSGDALQAALEREITIDRSKLDGETSEETLAKFNKEADLERIMLEGYLEWLKETGADSELEIIAPEVYLEAGLDEFGEAVAIIGKLDVRVRRNTDGAHLFMDHKSMAEFTTVTRTVAMDEQMLHYHLLEVMNGDQEKRTAGALYNMLRRVKRTGTAKPPFYMRLEVRHNDIELASYRQRLVGTIMDMLDVADKLEAGMPHHEAVYPRPTRDCTWDCPFFAVCPMFDDGSRAEDMLTQFYVQGDPLEYYLTEALDLEE